MFKLKALLITLIASTAALLFSGTLQAGAIYGVSSTGLVNCGDDPHGLWTNSDYNGSGGNCPNYFDIQAGSTLGIDDSDADPNNWFAELDALAVNDGGLLALIDLTFTGYSEDHTLFNPIKNGGGATAAQIADWIFFADVSGTISVGADTYNITGLAGNTGLQIGWGANDKTSAFGASTWLNGDFDSGHWDINMDLALVPEPSSVALMLLGLLGLGIRRRKII